MTAARPTIAIIGAGRLGTVLAIALDQAEYPVVAVASRRSASAKALTARLKAAAVMSSADAAAQRAQIVFLTVPDDAIVGVDAAIHWRRGQIAIHCSGACSAAILAAAISAGATPASFHPLQSFAETELGLANFPGSAIGIEVAEEQWPVLAEIARLLGATPLHIRPEDRGAYHAASVLVSNGTVGLMAVAADLWKTLGIRRDDAVQALLPLLSGTVRNLEGLGLPGALTGPVSRGNTVTVEMHLAALADRPRELAIYRSITDRLIDAALESGTIKADQGEALRELLRKALRS